MHLLHCMPPALTGSASVTWEAHRTWPKKKKIIQAIKTNHPIFLGLSPTETAHTPHCSVCFTLGCSHFLSSPCLRVSLAFWDRLRCLWNVYCSKEVHSYLWLCLPLILSAMRHKESEFYKVLRPGMWSHFKHSGFKSQSELCCSTTFWDLYAFKKALPFGWSEHLMSCVVWRSKTTSLLPLTMSTMIKDITGWNLSKHFHRRPTPAKRKRKTNNCRKGPALLKVFNYIYCKSTSILLCWIPPRWLMLRDKKSLLEELGRAFHNWCKPREAVSHWPPQKEKSGEL